MVIDISGQMRKATFRKYRANTYISQDQFQAFGKRKRNQINNSEIDIKFGIDVTARYTDIKIKTNRNWLVRGV